MQHLKGSLLAMLFACLTWPLPAVAAGQDLNIEGVNVEQTVTVAGSGLVLNGAGVRHKLVFKVNVTAMYATKSFKSLDEFLALPGPKRVTLTMLREVSSDTIGSTLTRGIDDNTPRSELSKITPDLIRISDTFSAYKSLGAGDTILIDWIPGRGTVLSVKGKVQGEPFKDPEFFKAWMSIWLGSNPVEPKLKNALLGQP